jgi:hypothetical protein
LIKVIRSANFKSTLSPSLISSIKWFVNSNIPPFTLKIIVLKKF